jgi:hypothetical protein
MAPGRLPATNAGNIPTLYLRAFDDSHDVM